MLKVGLTGGIGSGKSTVSALFVAKGATLVDADLNARAVVAKGTPGLAAVVQEFGPQVLTEQGCLDRAALGQIVFADPERLSRLNEILHPIIGAESARQIAAAEASGVPVLIHDVPLLMENDLQGQYDAVIVVAASPPTQLRRLMQQRGMTRADAQARIGAQAPLADKLAAATYAIDNDGPQELLAAQVDQVWRALLTATAGSER